MKCSVRSYLCLYVSRMYSCALGPGPSRIGKRVYLSSEPQLCWPFIPPHSALGVHADLTDAKAKVKR